LPFIIPLLPKPIRMTARETRRYFQNNQNIGCEIRELLKQVLRPLLAANDKVFLIEHSPGSVQPCLQRNLQPSVPGRRQRLLACRI